MRIIRIVVILLAALAIIIPQLASANETINTDTKTKNTFSYIYDLLAPEAAKAEEVVEIVEKAVEKTPEEIEKDAILAKWKAKQAAKWDNLPKESFTINASAYTAAADECDKTDGVTASGIKVEANRTIACPPEFPFGAKIQIEGMGTYVCEDRGGAIKGNKIDIYMETKAEAFAFGRRNLTAQVVD